MSVIQNTFERLLIEEINNFLMTTEVLCYIPVSYSDHFFFFMSLTLPVNLATSASARRKPSFLARLAVE